MEGLTSLSLLDWLPVTSNLEKKSSVVIVKKKKGIVLYSTVRQPRARTRAGSELAVTSRGWMLNRCETHQRSTLAISSPLTLNIESLLMSSQKYVYNYSRIYRYN